MEQDIGRLLIAACTSAALLPTRSAPAYEFDLGVDLRAISTDATRSRLTAGLASCALMGTRTACA